MQIYKSKLLGYVPAEDLEIMASQFDKLAREYHETSYVRVSLRPLARWEFEDAAVLVLTNKEGHKRLILCTVHEIGHGCWCTPIDTQHLRWVRPLNPSEEYAQQHLPKGLVKRWVPY